jgi:hypothetical protein
MSAIRREPEITAANMTHRRGHPMQASILRSGTIAILTILAVFAWASESPAQPQPTLSLAYDYFPFSKLDNPTSGTFEEDLEIRVATFSTELTLAPMVFAQGKTVLVNTFSYHRFDLDYKNWDDPSGDDPIENAQGVEYTVVLVRQLSERWNLTTVVTPGLHSDFKGGLSSNDFNVSSALILGRQHSERLTLGFGLAFSFKYGEGYPLPFLSVAWNNGSNARVDMLLPVHAEFWYLPSPKVELGLAARVSGNQYHGDPDRYGVTDPQMRYSAGTVGPSIKLHASKSVSLTIDGGVTVRRRFEFFDGDEKAQSLDLKNTGFVKAGLQINL